MSDRIRLANLAVFARHGVHDAEAQLGQRFFLDVTVRLDLGAAGVTDHVADTVDYGVLAAVVIEAFSTRRKLIEAAAERVAAAVIERFDAVDSVEVVVRKPAAPVEAILDHAEIAITRAR